MTSVDAQSGPVTSSKEFLEELKTRLFERLSREIFKETSVYAFDSLQSTMDLSRELLSDGEESPGRGSKRVIVVSREQLSGRGRYQRVWESSRDLGLYVTYGLSPGRIRNLSGLSLVAGLSLIRTLRAFGIRGELKWPNDVLVEFGRSYKKISGVLVETSHRGQEIKGIHVGIGINLRRDRSVTAVGGVSIEEVLDSSATSREMMPSFGSVLSELSHYFFADFAKFQKEGFSSFQDEWNSNSVVSGRLIKRSTEEGGRESSPSEEEYTALEVDEEGRLKVVSDSGKIELLSSGEVVL